ncbi:MAG: NAD(P)H-quinone oxidoreductase [Steroidobacteraceae bacterium]|nr:NAD(P)H-quinone oxidoreductase [Steroidobacteraceae bacterium]
MMQAISIRGGKGGADALFVESLPVPEPGPGQLLVRVKAAGVNRPDIFQRAGFYPPPPGAPATLGLEVAGEVAAIGEGVTRWRPGDRVTALLGGGGYAEYALVDARHALPVPAGLDFVHAAALPETVFTVWSNVFERGQLQSGETLLVHGANSGIGVTAIQLAKAAGARVFATARGAAKAAQASEIGADVAIDAATGDWAEGIKAAGGVDVILDMVGAAYFERNLDVLAPDGRLVVIATLTGHEVQLNLRQLMLKRLTVTASTLRARHADEKARLARAIEDRVWPWIEAGSVKVPVDRTFPLERAGEAHAWLESGSQFGKVVLTVE